MTSLLMQPETHGLDAASFASMTNFQRCADAGASWLSFYIGGNFGIGKPQLEAAWNAGLPVMPNFERSASAAKGGYTVGLSHAQTAVAQLHNLGFIGECPVVFSGSDYSVPTADLPENLDYHRALVDVLDPMGWDGGAYGPKIVLEQLAVADWWPSDWPLWHWGGDWKLINQQPRFPWASCKQWYGLDQTPIDSTSLGFAVDENTLLKPMRFWSGYGSDPLLPDEETGMTPEQERKLDVILAALTADNGAGISTEWAVHRIDDWAQKHAADKIAAAVVAEMPVSGTSLTKQDITDAVNEAMRLITLNIGFGTG